MAEETNDLSGETQQAGPATQPGHARSGWARKLGDRYSDGYRIGQQLVVLGGIVKIIGYVLAGIAVLIGVVVFIVSLADGAPMRGIGVSLLALLYGAIIVFGWYVGGTVVTGIGQLILASFDGAVFNAPCLNDDERATILSLNLSEQDKS